MLSGKDNAVLAALFDAESSLSSRSAGVIIYQDQTSLNDNARAQEREVIQLLNTEKPDRASVDQAIRFLTNLIEEYPQYASAYNNRAQAERLLPVHEQDVSRILADLFEAVELASLQTHNMVSSSNARVLVSAHTHRAYLLMKASTDETYRKELSAADSIYQGLTPSELEAMASKDFAIAGRYGNKAAQNLAVKTNPYAKLCGSIVREALQKEIADFNVSLTPSV